LNNEFKTLIHGESSEYKTKFDKIKESYSDFNPDNLYLSGQAKLVNLWKANDWHGNYYLTSKEGDDNKLSIKYKGKDWSIDLTDGLFIQDLLPDSVKIFVSKIDVPNVVFDPQNQSNIEAYKQQIETEKTYTTQNNKKQKNNKYLFQDNKLLVNPDKVKNSDQKAPDAVNLNPIKLPYVGPGHSDKIFFKSKYYFDGIGLFNGEIFATNIKFKKAFYWDETHNSPALKSELTSSIWYGTNYIPLSKKNNPDRPTGNLVEWSFDAANNVGEFFWKDNGSSPENSIYGAANNPEGDGAIQLIEDQTKARDDFRTKINENKATNYIAFPRIAYKTNSNDYSYLWTNDATIIYFQNKS
ncbi:hypothetical protein, partial [Mycoplasma bradburyae]|uniref:hypothetical protein n=1 Tax=Mycoplasma bradburyae TaxID=2963128 RepID=UPI002341CBB7